jgi:hypothetical protein
MISGIIALMAASAAQLGDGSTSNPPPTSKPAVTAPAPAPQKDSDKVVCRMIIPTGERLGGTKVCHTKAEWDAMNRDARDQTNSMQTHGLQGGVPNG